MHIALTYIGSIFKEINMMILDVGTYLDWIVKKEKSTSTFGMSFLCFGPFWVWVATHRSTSLIATWCNLNLQSMTSIFPCRLRSNTFDNHECNNFRSTDLECIRMKTGSNFVTSRLKNFRSKNSSSKVS